jgi:preprotein translocase subunit SecA
MASSAQEMAVNQLLDRVAELNMRPLPGVTPDLERLERAMRPAPRPRFVQRENVPQVGRNEPCPCGSGTKYKRCCGA